MPSSLSSLASHELTGFPAASREAQSKNGSDGYHCHIQFGVIAQWLLQAVAILDATSVWRGFGSWLRTVRAGVPPSERVVALALRNALPEFLADSLADHILAKFIRQRLDLSRAEGLRLAS